MRKGIANIGPGSSDGVQDVGYPLSFITTARLKGPVYVKPNRVMAASAAVARNVFVLDTDMVKFLWLRKLAEDKDVARTGDAEKCIIVGEGTLKVANEAGIGVIADVYGLTASS